MAEHETINGQPWWVKAVAFIGFPAVVAGFLIYHIVITQASALAQHIENDTKNNSLIESHVQQTEKYYKKQAQFFWIICRSLARPEDKEKCENVNYENP